MDTALRLLLFEDPRSRVAVSYSEKVLNLATANLLGYWRLQEAAGSNADNFEGTAARDGTYTGVTLGQDGIGDGLTCPLFDGANDFVDVFSASLNTAFVGAEGTLSAWARVSGVGVWTDGSHRHLITIARNTTTDRIHLKKISVDNRLEWLREGANTIDSVTRTDESTTDWFHMAITWSEAADEVRAYFDGAQEGVTQTGLGTASDILQAANCNIGAQTDTPNRSWDGRLAHVALWDTPLTAAQILDIATL